MTWVETAVERRDECRCFHNVARGLSWVWFIHCQLWRQQIAHSDPIRLQVQLFGDRLGCLNIECGRMGASMANIEAEGYLHRRYPNFRDAVCSAGPRHKTTRVH
jgi:hypothetical protein